MIEERNAGGWWHAAWQITLGALFFNQSDAWSIRVRTEQRTRTGERRYRVPDVAVFDEHTPPDPVALQPPLLALKVLSPEDRISRLLMRFKGAGLQAADEVLLRDRVIAWQEIAAMLR